MMFRSIIFRTFATMAIKRKILLILCSLLVSFAAVAHAPDRGSKEALSKVATVDSNDRGPFNKESIETVQCLLSSLIKINETNTLFKNLKDSKKGLLTISSRRPPVCFNTYYNSYTTLTLNSVHCFPFYIAYHRLTI
jgi:hypothetical protein